MIDRRRTSAATPTARRIPRPGSRSIDTVRTCSTPRTRGCGSTSTASPSSPTTCTGCTRRTAAKCSRCRSTSARSTSSSAPPTRPTRPERSSPRRPRSRASDAAEPRGEGDRTDRPPALRGVHPRLHRQAVADRPAASCPRRSSRRLPVRYTYDNRYFNDTTRACRSTATPRGSSGWPTTRGSRCGSRPTSSTSRSRSTGRLVGRCRSSTPVRSTGTSTIPRASSSWRTWTSSSEVLPIGDFQGTSVMNYADPDVPFTRIQEFRHFHPERDYPTDATVIMREYSRFADTRRRALLPGEHRRGPGAVARLPRTGEGASRRCYFGGRLGTYRYLDMHMAIGAALSCSRTDFVHSSPVRLRSSPATKLARGSSTPMTWFDALPTFSVAALLMFALGAPFALAIGARGIGFLGISAASSVAVVAASHPRAGGRAVVDAPRARRCRGIDDGRRPAAPAVRRAPRRMPGEWGAPSSAARRRRVGAVLIGRNVVLGIGVPDHPSQTYDAVFHLNAVRWILNHATRRQSTW